MRHMIPLLALLLFASPAAAAPDVVVRSKRLYTSGVLKDVSAEVTVKNYGDTAAENVTVVFDLKPHVPSESTFHQEVRLGTLEPGEEKTAQYKSPLRAQTEFNGGRDVFVVEVVDHSNHTGRADIRYTFTADVRSQAAASRPAGGAASTTATSRPSTTTGQPVLRIQSRQVSNGGAGNAVNVSLTLRNYGEGAGRATVTCRVLDSSNKVRYEQSRSTAVLEPNASATVEFRTGIVSDSLVDGSSTTFLASQYLPGGGKKNEIWKIELDLKDR